ncbi:MAG: hypothetical protein MI799_03705 [Desulfobacterales bacterium]|nr:hypothetical protein [Desulfobacterales bacterium]
MDAGDKAPQILYDTGTNLANLQASLSFLPGKLLLLFIALGKTEAPFNHRHRTRRKISKIALQNHQQL